jgi:hypothetical protein
MGKRRVQGEPGGVELESEANREIGVWGYEEWGIREWYNWDVPQQPIPGVGEPHNRIAQMENGRAVEWEMWESAQNSPLLFLSPVMGATKILINTITYIYVYIYI